MSSSFARTKLDRKSKFLKTKPRPFSLQPGKTPMMLNTFPWANDARFQIVNFHLGCMQNLQILDFLAHGAYGMTYKARYLGQRCVLKIVPLDFTKKPITQKTSKNDFEREVKILQIVSDAGVGPKVFQHGICAVDLLDVQAKKQSKIQIGFVLLEYFDVSLKKLVTDALDHIGTITSLAEFKSFLFQMTKFFIHIDQQIHADLQRCVTELHLHPRDLHRDNLLYHFQTDRARVVDWGMTTLSRKSQTSRRRHPDEQPDSTVVLAQPLYYTSRFLKDVEKEIRVGMPESLRKTSVLNTLRLGLGFLNI